MTEIGTTRKGERVNNTEKNLFLGSNKLNIIVSVMWKYAYLAAS